MRGASGLVARSLLRRGWVGAVVVGVLVGIAGGAVLAAVAGARRTEDAFPRLQEQVNAADVRVGPRSGGDFDVDEIAELPQVEVAATLYSFLVAVVSDAGVPDLVNAPSGRGSANGNLYYEIERLRLDRGRLPEPEALDEIAINREMAEQFELDVGDVYDGALLDFPRLLEAAELEDPEEFAEELDAASTPVELEVVGVYRSDAGIIPSVATEDEAVMVLSPGFADEYADRRVGEAIAALLRDGGRDVDAFEAAVRRLFPDTPLEFTTLQGSLDTVSDEVRPYSGVLLAFAVVAAITSFLVLGQIITRQVMLDGEDGPTLRSLGMSTPQLVDALVARALVTAVVAGVVAVIGAVIASRWFPLGPARLAEPDPGIDIDALVLGLGFLAIVVVVIGRAAFTAWRVARRATRPSWFAVRARPSVVADRVAAAGGPPPTVTGVRLALQRGGPIPPVATIAGLVLAVAVIVGTLAFGESMSHVVSTPRLYGWNWDVMFEGYDLTLGGEDGWGEQVEDDDDLASVTIGARTAIRIDDQDLRTFAFEVGEGHLQPTIVDGEPPTGPDEIALARGSMDDLGVALGDTVEAEGLSSGERRELEVVGQVVVPQETLGRAAGLDEGAVLSLDGLEQVEPDLSPYLVFADLAGPATVGDMQGRYDTEAAVTPPDPPVALLGYKRVSGAPLVLAGLLTVLGGGVLVYTIVTSILRRRRDLAVLKAVGFVRPQVIGAVATQATTLTLVAVLFGLPIGLALGRWTWIYFADRLGVVAEPVVPWAAVAIAPLAAFGLANLIAFPPGRNAAGTEPAVALRAE